MTQGLKGGRKSRNSPTILVSEAYPTNLNSSSEHEPRNNSIPCKAVRKIYRDREQPQEKENYRTNQGVIF